MKIIKIETLRIPEHPNIIWIKIHTDEGIVGLGESWFGAEAIEADIHTRIAPIIIGMDPQKIENLYSLMRPYVGFSGTGTEMRAISAIDVAIWDINAKFQNINNICPTIDIVQCFENTNINNDGTIKGNININQNENF